VSEGAGDRQQNDELLTLMQCFVICTTDAETVIFQHTPEPSRKSVP